MKDRICIGFFCKSIITIALICALEQGCMTVERQQNYEYDLENDFEEIERIVLMSKKIIYCKGREMELLKSDLNRPYAIVFIDWDTVWTDNKGSFRTFNNNDTILVKDILKIYAPELDEAKTGLGIGTGILISIPLVIFGTLLILALSVYAVTVALTK